MQGGAAAWWHVGNAASMSQASGTTGAMSVGGRQASREGVGHSEGDDATPYLRRLDRLARFLLSGRYRDATRLWKLQLDLLSLQQDVQGRISELKSRERDAESHRRLEELRQVRAQARRFGDAVAWLFLGLDHQKLIPLSDNDPVRIPDRIRDEHSLRGTLAFAQAMANDGWGFPLLHDITDCLRIGDITFIRRDADGDLTVEIKTRHRDRVASGETVTYSYDIAALAARPLPVVASLSSQDISREGMARNSPTRGDRRMPRQFDRLLKVKARQDATPEDITEIKGEPPMLSRDIDANGVSRWEVLRSVARRARRYGYAAEAVDEAFVFAAMYDPNGIAPDRMPGAESLVSDILTSRMLPAENRDRNAIWINTVPEEGRRTAPKYLPYFLYPLPRSTILDLLHGRMLLFHLSNPAQIATALSNAGFTAKPRHGNDFRSGFDVRTEIQDEHGRRYALNLGGLESPMREMIMEFYSLEYIVRVAEGMTEAALHAMATRTSTLEAAS